MAAAIYQGYIKDETGAIIEGASVEVRDQDTNAIVDLWSNRATTSTKTNPTTTDANGYYFFYRTAGRYKITVTSGAYSATFNNVSIGTAQEYDTGTDAGDIPLNSDLATVAGTGDYDDLINKPTLGTIVSYNYGTAGGEVQTNSLNDARFFRIGNNLSEGTASAMRANLALGSGDAVTFASVAAATIDTGQGAVECYAMDQAVSTTSTVTFAQINGDNIRIDGNTISSTNTNGNITIDTNGTGTVELAANTNVTGAISATNSGANADINITSGTGSVTTGTSTLNLWTRNAASAVTYSRATIAGVSVAPGDTDLVFSTTTNSGGPVERVRVPHNGGMDVTGALTATTGITVATGQTQLSNYLEGEYAATLTCGTSGTITLDSTVDTLSYTRIGNRVHVQGYLSVSSVSSPVGDLRLSLPFVSGTGSELSGALVGKCVVGDSVSKTTGDFVTFINASVSYASIALLGNTLLDFTAANQIKAATYITVNFSYEV